MNEPNGQEPGHAEPPPTEEYDVQQHIANEDAAEAELLALEAEQAAQEPVGDPDDLPPNIG